MPDELFDALWDSAWQLPTDDGLARLAVFELGSGHAVVTLHCGPGAHHSYLIDAVRGSLDQARFIFFDQRGSVLSPTPSFEVTCDQLILDLETLRNALGLQKFVFLGHSWGSLLAQLYFVAHPDHVAGMVLTGAMLPYSAPAGWGQEMQARQQSLMERPEVEEILERSGLPDGTDDPRVTSARQHMTGMASFSVYRLERWQKVRPIYWNMAVGNSIGETIPAHYDIRPTLTRHPIAITVLQGDHDYLEPGATSWQELARSNPDVTVEVLHDAGHNAWVDDPDTFGRLLRDALQRMAKGSD